MLTHPMGHVDTIPAEEPIVAPPRTGQRWARKRARRRTLATWMVVVIVYLFIGGAGAFLIPTFFWGLGHRAVLAIHTVAFGLVPLGIAIAGIVATVRAGRRPSTPR